MSIVRWLMRLVERPEWEVQHAGLLGLRCAVALRGSAMAGFAANLVAPMLAALRAEVSPLCWRVAADPS